MADCEQPPCMDKSLTSMEWLHQMNAGSGVESMRNLTLGPTDCQGERRCNGTSPPGSTPESPRDGKPRHSYANLIMLAVNSSPRKMMTLSEIYDWITDNFSYFKDAGNGWKNSIRHNLSLNKCFVKVPRSKDDPGKGSYWTVDDNFQDDMQFRKKRRPLPPYSSDSSFSSSCCSSVADSSTKTHFAFNTTFSDLSASFCKLYQDVCEKRKASEATNGVNYDWMHNIDTLKESLRLAGSASSTLVLDDIDMSQFKSLLESMKQAEHETQGSVTVEQFRSLTTTLTSLLDQAGILPAEAHAHGEQLLSQQHQQLLQRHQPQQQQQQLQQQLAYLHNQPGSAPAPPPPPPPTLGPEFQPLHHKALQQQQQQPLHGLAYTCDLPTDCTTQSQGQLQTCWGPLKQANMSPAHGSSLAGGYVTAVLAQHGHHCSAQSPTLAKPDTMSAGGGLTATVQGPDLRWLARQPQQQHVGTAGSFSQGAAMHWQLQRQQHPGTQQREAHTDACHASQLPDDEENPFDTDWDRML